MMARVACAFVDVVRAVRARVPRRAANVLFAMQAHIARAEVASQTGAVICPWGNETLCKRVVTNSAVEARLSGALVDVLFAVLARPSVQAVAEIRIHAVAATECAGLVARGATTLIHVVTTQIPTKASRAVALKVVVKIHARGCILAWIGGARVALF